MFKDRVDKLVYRWEGKIIFWVSFVEIGLVNTYYPFYITLFYEDNIGETIWVMNFLDENL